MNFGINVFDFGAKGDGIADDTAAIQAAINYAAERGGGKLPKVSVLKYGVYDPENRLRGGLLWHKPKHEQVFPVFGAENFDIKRF